MGNTLSFKQTAFKKGNIIKTTKLEVTLRTGVNEICYLSQSQKTINYFGQLIFNSNAKINNNCIALQSCKMNVSYI